MMIIIVSCSARLGKETTDHGYQLTIDSGQFPQLHVTHYLYQVTSIKYEEDIHQYIGGICLTTNYLILATNFSIFQRICRRKGSPEIMRWVVV